MAAQHPFAKNWSAGQRGTRQYYKFHVSYVSGNFLKLGLDNQDSTYEKYNYFDVTSEELWRKEGKSGLLLIRDMMTA